MIPEQPVIVADPPAQQRRGRKGVRLFALSVAVAATLLLLGVILVYGSIHRSAARQAERLTTLHHERQSAVNRLEQAAEHARFDRQLVLSVLRQCRSVEDIPQFASNRIAANRQGLEQVFVYVPAGSHRLQMRAAWRPSIGKRRGPGEPVAEQPAPSGLQGEKTYSVPLLGDSGYLLQITSGYRPGPIEWELTSNDPNFATQHGKLPPQDFERTGYSSRGPSRFLTYPNPLDYSATIRGKPTAPGDDGLQLVDATLRGRIQDQPYEVQWTVRLVSDGPPSMSAQDVERLLTLEAVRKKGAFTYRGAGRYEFQESDSTTSADD